MAQLIAFGPTIKVDVYGTVREYRQMIAEYGDHIASGGQTISLHDALRQARAFFRANRREEAITAVSFWVHMDESGLAYRVLITPRGSYCVTGASPMSGPNNVRPIYKANGDY